jgi:DNA-directed RNA polymerase subunit RPC12/RpoP
MADFVTLSCPSCGGKLQITQDVERFACGYCGQEYIVKRSGGIVSLSPILDALNKVEVGVDKTASELAIVRVKNEIAEFHRQRAALLQLHPRPSTASPLFAVILIFGCIFSSFSLWEIFSSQSGVQSGSIIGVTFGAALVAFGAVPLLTKTDTKNWDKTTGAQIKLLDEQLATKDAELKHYQDIVSI